MAMGRPSGYPRARMAQQFSLVERAAREAAERRDNRLLEEPERRKSRGIVHTPTEVARRTVLEVHEILRSELGCRGGIGDRRVALVDPACGPGTFLAAAVALGSDARRYGPPAIVRGRDVDAQAVADAEQVLGDMARGAGWPLELIEGDSLAATQPWVPQDSDLIPVVIGNPPWASRTANAEAEEVSLWLEDFKRDEDGKRLSERKLGVLSDDYVRFFRWAAEMTRHARAGGVLAFVTNASFLDGPVHRGMRGALRRWFDEVRVWDLGGSALVARTGEGRDDNVFGVRPSVSVTVAFHGGQLEPRAGRVRYARVRGTKDEKFRELSRGVTLEALKPSAPTHLFKPEAKVSAAYHGWPSLDEIFVFHQEGVQTNRDEAVIASDAGTLLRRLADFAEGRPNADLVKARTTSAHYDPERAQEVIAEQLADAPKGEGFIVPLAYRPGDNRVFAAISGFCHRPRHTLVNAMSHGGHALLTVRKDRGERLWQHVAMTDRVVDNCFLSARSSCRTRAFTPFTPEGEDNLDPQWAERFAEAVGEKVCAQGVIHYAAAVLASTAYRHAFDGALKLDYPRIPVPPSSVAWAQLTALGAELPAVMHSIRAAEADEPTVNVGHHRVFSPPMTSWLGSVDAAVSEHFAKAFTRA